MNHYHQHLSRDCSKGLTRVSTIPSLTRSVMDLLGNWFLVPNRQMSIFTALLRGHSILSTMARLDKVKNLLGLVEMYGKSENLKEFVHLGNIGGEINAEKSRDREEVKEIEVCTIFGVKIGNWLRWI